MSQKTYTEEEKLLVWQKASIVSGYDSKQYRKDICGAWIEWSSFGNRDSEYGWEIDHIIPISRGGRHHIDNVQPLQWENNAAKADGPLICKRRG